jgi:hypothetical protein
MPNLTPQQKAKIPILLPSLIDWAERMEKKALSEGTALNKILRDAADFPITSARLCQRRRDPADHASSQSQHRNQ